MRISILVNKLLEYQEELGDVNVLVHDGLDPSDMMEVGSFEVETYGETKQLKIYAK